LRLIHAKTLLALKKLKEAQREFDLLLEENPEDEFVLEQLLNIEIELKEWNNAYTRAQILLQRKPEDTKLWERTARVLLQVGKRSEAVELYLKLGVRAVKDNKMDEALRQFDTLLFLDGENIEALKKKAEINLRLGRKQDVMTDYRQLEKVFEKKKLPEEARKVRIILNKLASLKG